MAEALFNQLSPNNHADSAGTDVDIEGETIGERSKRVPAARDVLVSVLSDEGLDIFHKKRNQLSPEMLNDYEKVVVIISEPEDIPDWLRQSPKFTQWHIDDPRGKGLEETRKTKDEIKRRIVSLIDSISTS